ncbi:XRE family transcriptional regulator [Methylophilus sp. 13]|uniref:XRE family transcriptional regulator n=1 Tax=Methylophilus sp. 13 TaxID=2781018 RepID=UPI00188E7FA2|nr:XRE family transcriptional regulator [Methylophilus sp. 13]MBF5039887.1 XRE family transcriptional regulator [Methylophilus sp. 13]
MTKKFSELHSQMKPESQLRSQANTKQLLAEMPLHQLQQARGLTQKLLAELLNEKKRSIAKLEKRADMYVSTLRTHIQAMGGGLQIVARFPLGSVSIGNFSELERESDSNYFD